jgi:hypothetical protein
LSDYRKLQHSRWECKDQVILDSSTSGGDATIRVARHFGERIFRFVGHRFWAHGCFVLAAGWDEERIRLYMPRSEVEEIERDQLKFF